MSMESKTSPYFKNYYAKWIAIYKEGAVRDVTLAKYQMSLSWIRKLVPKLKLCDLNRYAISRCNLLP